MPGRQDHDLPLSEQRFGIQACEVIHWLMHQGRIGASAAQQTGLLAYLTQQNLRRWHPSLTCRGLKESLQQGMGGSSLGGQYQCPPWVLGSLRPACRGRGGLKGCPGLTQEHLSRIGQGHAAAVAFKEADAEASLQLGNCTGERRLGNAELQGCPPKMQVFRNGHKVPQFPGLELDHTPHLTGDTSRVSQCTELVLDAVFTSDP